MKKVWIVSLSDYDVYEILGVFSKKKKARKFAEQQQAEKKYGYVDYTSYVVDWALR